VVLLKTTFLEINLEVKTYKDLENLSKKFKKDSLTIGTINGTYDLLHDGHKDAISYALKNVDKLFLLLNSDESVSLYKGPSRPIENEKKRSKNLLKAFPKLILFTFNELNPLNAIEHVKPDVHFIGPDWGRNTLEQDLVESHKGKIMSIKKNIDISTSMILHERKIQDTIKKAIFFDRDGTIIHDKNYLTDKEKINFFPESLNALKKLQDLNFLLFIVTNQSMVGRGISTKTNAIEIHDEILKKLNENGVKIQESFIDFSHPDENSKSRKPNTFFLEVAAEKYALSLKNCWTIGDRESDIIFGKRGNTKTIQIKNSKYNKSKFSDYFVNNLNDAYEIILKY